MESKAHSLLMLSSMYQVKAGQVEALVNGSVGSE